MIDGTGFRTVRFGPKELDGAWLARSCRTIWDQVSGEPKGVHVLGGPDGALLVIKAGRRRRLRKGRSLAAAHAARELRAAGVRTPEVYAVCNDAGGWLDALVMEHVRSVPVLESLHSPFSRDWLGEISRSIAAMHAAGFRHRDLKSSNLLLVSSDGQREAWIIDLDGARRCRFGVPPRTRARDLARTMLSLEVMGVDDGVLLEHYAIHAPWSEADVERARKHIEGYKKRKRAQNVRRGRELT